jgi:hypothetical protein
MVARRSDMTEAVMKASLSPQKKRLVELMQSLNYGRIEQLVVRDGEPIFDPPPQILREFKPGGDNARRPEAQLDDFELKREVLEFLNHLDHLGNATIRLVEVKHGLPFKALVEEAAA